MHTIYRHIRYAVLAAGIAASSGASAAAPAADCPSCAIGASAVLSGLALSVAAEGVHDAGKLAGNMSVAAVEQLGDGVKLVLRSASTGAQASVRLSGATAGTVSVAVGTSVEAVAYSTGSLLIASGRAIAFVPNAIGRDLLYHARLQPAAP
ncbi:MAG TPA: hypothetical protein VIT92_01625 [Burkholderiaceae bacterium]